jgi:hypothetical protein
MAADPVAIYRLLANDVFQKCMGRMPMPLTISGVSDA